MAITFNRYHVTNGTLKARVHYCLDNRADGRACITVYSRDYGHGLGQIGRELNAGYINDTDSQTDYFDKGRMVVFSDHPRYAELRRRVEALIAADTAACQVRLAKRLAAVHGSQAHA